MLFPKFSTRLIFAITTVTALFFLVVKFAYAGELWAVGLVFAFGSVPVFFVAYSLIFLLAFALVRTTRVRPNTSAASPFVTEAIPPQVIPPDDSQTVN